MAIESKGDFVINAEEPHEPATVNIPNYPRTEIKESPLVRTQKLLKVFKVSLGPLALTQILYVLPGAYPLLINFAGCFLGLAAAFKLSSYLLKVFCVYLVVLGICQVALMALVKGTAFIVLESFCVCFEGFVFFVGFRTFRCLDSLSENDFNLLKS
jgi:hypothetical protein